MCHCHNLHVAKDWCLVATVMWQIQKKGTLSIKKKLVCHWFDSNIAADLCVVALSCDKSKQAHPFLHGINANGLFFVTVSTGEMSTDNASLASNAQLVRFFAMQMFFTFSQQQLTTCHLAVQWCFKFWHVTLAANYAGVHILLVKVLSSNMCHCHNLCVAKDWCLVATVMWQIPTGALSKKTKTSSCCQKCKNYQAATCITCVISIFLKIDVLLLLSCDKSK